MTEDRGPEFDRVFTYTVTVTCQTEEQAAQAMAERLNHEEDYGFNYLMTWHSRDRSTLLGGYPEAGILEAICGFCGLIYNPAGEDDLIHGDCKARADVVALPLPGEPIIFPTASGDPVRPSGTVVASTWINDDTDPATALLMVLNAQPAYYSVCEVEVVPARWGLTTHTDFPNINPATAFYAESGGDY